MTNSTTKNLASHKWSVLSIALSVTCYVVVYVLINRLDSLHLWMPESLEAKRLASVQMAVALAAMVLGGVALKRERPVAWGAIALVVGFLCFASAAA
jgi:uncharacterized membrane protein YgdD (TMEM256/DUF423 family)